MFTQTKVIIVSLVLLLAAGAIIFWRINSKDSANSLSRILGSPHTSSLAPEEFVLALPEDFPMSEKSSVSSSSRDLANGTQELYYSYVSDELLESSFTTFLNYFSNANWLLTNQQLNASTANLSAYKEDVLIKVSVYQRSGSPETQVELVVSKRK